MRIFFYPNLIFIWNKKKAINGDRIYYPLISPRALYICMRYPCNFCSYHEDKIRDQALIFSLLF